MTDGHVAYEIGAASDIGGREVNEDRFVTLDLGNGAWFVAVADGVGGNPAGEVASDMAVTMLQGSARKWKLKKSAEVLADTMDAAIRRVHARIVRHGWWRSEWKGMATTIACALLLPGGVVHRYAGDSNLLWSRQDRLLYRASPHLIDGAIFSCLGSRGGRPLLSPRRDSEYDWFLNVKAGDTVVLSTDGVLSCLAEGTLLGMFAEEGAAPELADRLVQAALKAEQTDNVTAVAIRVRDPG